jgi:hypothetical protein
MHQLAVSNRHPHLLGAFRSEGVKTDTRRSCLRREPERQAVKAGATALDELRRAVRARADDRNYR